MLSIIVKHKLLFQVDPQARGSTSSAPKGETQNAKNVILQLEHMLEVGNNTKVFSSLYPNSPSAPIKQLFRGDWAYWWEISDCSEIP